MSGFFTSMQFTISIFLLIGGVFSLSIPGSATSITIVDVVMDMHEPFYSPTVATISNGQTIQWSNRSHVPHTITHDGCIRRGACAFESGPVHPGKRFMVTHLKPGTYSYHCSIHPFMRGKIVVKKRALRYSHDL